MASYVRHNVTRFDLAAFTQTDVPNSRVVTEPVTIQYRITSTHFLGLIETRCVTVF
jgi:hypothetical protein